MGKIIREPEFAARVRSQRRALGLTQKECCERVGVIKQVWSNWEAGIAKPMRMATLRKVATVLDCTPHWLLHGGNDEATSAMHRVATTARALVRDIKHLDKALKIKGKKAHQTA